MFAVIKTGGKQYRVAGGESFTIERVAGAAGDTVSFAEVLMVGTTIGAPFVSGASVAAEIVEQVRGPKVISFKKRRRQNSKRTRGHRQDLTLVRITEILTDGKKPSKRAAEPAKKAAPAAAEPSPTAADTAPVAGTEGAAATAAPAAAEKPKRAKAEKTAAVSDAPVQTAGTPDEIQPKKPRTTKKKAETSDEA